MATRKLAEASAPTSTQKCSPNGTASEEHGPVDTGAAAGLDVLLTDAAQGPLRRMLPGRAAVKTAAKLALKPDAVALRTLRLTTELAKIAAGRSDIEADKRDRRFKDQAWRENPVFRRLLQTYLATGRTVDGLICDADLDWASERRVRFAAENVLDALAPTNVPVTNPAAMKAALDTGGSNFTRGARNLVRDMSRPPRIPAMVDTSAFEVGRDLAVTPGAVVLRTPVLELIEYEPQTPKVRERPLLLVPPMINKYYIADLAPGRSMLEHVVKDGQRAFAISWRNPDERHASWNLETYATSVLAALEAVESITGSDATHVLGLCAGGIVLSTVVAVLAARGEQDRIAGLTLGVCVLDNRRAGTAGAFMDPGTATLATADSARRGYLDGRSLAGVFAWLRPNDLVWNYWVSNYLLGNPPPAFDILYWNADTTNMSAGLHRDFVRVALENPLSHPGDLELLGTPIDLSQITVDTYLVAGISDHITPWTSAYRSVRLLGSRPRFVLSTSGHIAAMVNPPGNEKASFRVNDALPDDPDAWLRDATMTPGSWWQDWTAWLGERSGGERDAPQDLGDTTHRALGPAPGTYVRE
ncbi:MAG TPA: alpha/beta fold hydrolase [Solirubrobacteraceae bacterium]|nr:alpha/beta fold hydrolase [Solirubrobacteraceae bacterium]